VNALAGGVSGGLSDLLDRIVKGVLALLHVDSRLPRAEGVGIGRMTRCYTIVPPHVWHTLAPSHACTNSELHYLLSLTSASARRELRACGEGEETGVAISKWHIFTAAVWGDSHKDAPFAVIPGRHYPHYRGPYALGLHTHKQCKSLT